MTKFTRNRMSFFSTYCLPVILGIALAQYLDIITLVKFVLTVVVSSLIIYGLLIVFYHHEEG